MLGEPVQGDCFTRGADNVKIHAAAWILGRPSANNLPSRPAGGFQYPVGFASFETRLYFCVIQAIKAVRHGCYP